METNNKCEGNCAECPDYVLCFFGNSAHFEEVNAEVDNCDEIEDECDCGEPHRLADEHWDYIRALLTNHFILDDTINMIDFHYRTAFIHGYKHGQEDAERCMNCQQTHSS